MRLWPIRTGTDLYFYHFRSERFKLPIPELKNLLEGKKSELLDKPNRRQLLNCPDLGSGWCVSPKLYPPTHFTDTNLAFLEGNCWISSNQVRQSLLATYTHGPWRILFLRVKKCIWLIQMLSQDWCVQVFTVWNDRWQFATSRDHHVHFFSIVANWQFVGVYGNKTNTVHWVSCEPGMCVPQIWVIGQFLPSSHPTLGHPWDLMFGAC